MGFYQRRQYSSHLPKTFNYKVNWQGSSPDGITDFNGKWKTVLEIKFPFKGGKPVPYQNVCLSYPANSVISLARCLLFCVSTKLVSTFFLNCWPFFCFVVSTSISAAMSHGRDILCNGKLWLCSNSHG